MGIIGKIWKFALNLVSNEHQNSQDQTDSLEGEEQSDDGELSIETDCEQKILEQKCGYRKQRLNVSTEDEENPKSPTFNAFASTSEHEPLNDQNEPGHIERTVSSILVKTERILYFYRSWNDVLFIVNCDEKFAKELSNKKDVNTMELSQYMNKKICEITGYVLILSTTNKCTSFQFETICEESKIPNVYVLQQFDKEHCILILSKGEKLEYADTKKTFKEKEIFKTFNNPLHVFCAHSGMGKTTLLQVLRDRHCPPECQVIYIALKEYNKLKDDPHNFGDLTEKLNEHRGPKTYLFLDGLDELKSEFTDDLLNFVKFVSSRGVNVWLASRENLRELICEKLYAVPIEILELNKVEQENYIKRKLKKSYENEDIKKITDALFTRAQLKDDENLLGNPLQLELLTEIFLEDKNKETLQDVKNNNLFNLTILTQMYKTFFKGKVKIAQEKHLCNDQVRLLKPLDDILQDYELPALQACFSNEDCNKLSLNFDAKEVKDFINYFKKDDDEIGIICKIDKNDKAMFTHQAYAEYFAARWFKRHPEKLPLLRDEIFSGKHQHLRMIFDVMLAENSPLHLAVIYKDIEQVKEHIQDVDNKDECGRTALHLACSYGQKYLALGDPEKCLKQLENQEQESPAYLNLIKLLFQKGRKILKQKDELFDFDCVRYALQSQCWLAIDWMLKLKITSFKKMKKIIRKHYNYNMKWLAFCAAQYGYSSLLQNVITHYPDLRKEPKVGETLLNLAITGCKGDVSMDSTEVHIERTVSSILVRTEDILNSYQSCDILFIVNCDGRFAKKLSNKEDVNTMELSQYMSKTKSQIPQNVLILSTRNKCTTLQLETICEESKISNVYVVQQFDKEHCILILSKGRKLEYADPTKTFKEDKILEIYNNPLHVLCAPSEMGKTTLMKVLRANCASRCLVEYVPLRDYSSFLENRPDFKTVFEEFMGIGTTGDKLFGLLNNHRGPKMHLLLDGLDALKSEHTDLVLEFVKFVSSTGVNVWLASRENLRKKICQTLHTVPIKIEEFKKEQQERYMHLKLKKSYSNEDRERIKHAVFSSVELNKTNNLLGNPLNLHIVTDIFLNSKQNFGDAKISDLLNVTGLTQFYKIFLTEKIQYVKKKNLHKDPERLYKHPDDILQDYELPALQACLSEQDCNKLSLNFDAENVKGFINKFKKDDDVIGIICKTDENGKAKFNHQTYAEYFAACWFKKHPKTIPVLRKEILSEEYKNLRLILDLMLAEKNPLHLAVIYKDIRQARRHIQDINCKDEGGRTALHLVCSWGQKYPELHDPEKRIKQLENQKQESSAYLNMIKLLFKKGRKILKEKDELFHFDCVRYALESQCWSALNLMLKLKIISLKRLETLNKKYCYNYDTSLFKIQDRDGELLTVGRESNVEAFNISMKRSLKLKETPILENVCTDTRKGNVEAVNILIKSGLKLKELPTLDYACKEKCFDMLEILIVHKAKCSRGNTILHVLVKNCPQIYCEEILTAMKKFNIDVNARNDDGATALHKAAESADLKIVEMLMANGADFRILDNDGRSPWHHALSRSRQDITELFLARELISVNDQNENGTTPLHFASKEGKTDIMKMFLERGAKSDLTDNVMNNALHYAVNSTCGIPDAVPLLIKSGIDPNTKNQDGFAPIHLAYNKGDFKTADLLLENGAEDKINAKSKDGKTVLHLACYEHRREDVIQLLERGADPNIVDDDNRNALHYYLLEFYAEDVIRAMINHGIDLNIRYEKGDTLLHIVCSQGDTHTMTKLIKKGVNVNMTNDENRSALHALFQTLQHTELRVMDRLINRHKYGIDIQHEHDPNTLHFGCEGCYHSLVKLEPLREDEEYKHKLYTILDGRDLTEMFLKYTPTGKFARKNVFLTARIITFKMIHCLVEHGLDITKVDKSQKTALDYASNLKKEYPEIMNLLEEANLKCQQNFPHDYIFAAFPQRLIPKLMSPA